MKFHFFIFSKSNLGLKLYFQISTRCNSFAIAHMLVSTSMLHVQNLNLLYDSKVKVQFYYTPL